MPSLKNPKADLRKLYYRTFKVSLILSLTVIVAAFKFSPQVSKIESVKTDPQEIIRIEDIINTVQKPDIPPPPKAPQIITATVDDLSDDIVLPDIDDAEPVKLPDKPPTKPTVDISDEPFIEYPEELPSPEPIDCHPGCHYCCYNQPIVTPPEALLIGHSVEETFTDRERSELFERMVSILELTRDKGQDEIMMMRHDLPCIFLINGMCSVYEVRPAICRACSSTSAEHCATVFESRDTRARLRCYAQIP